jgi:putative addiction module killer protein
MRRLREYEDAQGCRPFSRWFDSLDTPAALRVRTYLARLEVGHNSALKAVGEGVHELRIDFGPGYRVYVGMDGETLVILLGGSAKARQQAAISDAQERRKTYRQCKRSGEGDKEGWH